MIFKMLLLLQYDSFTAKHFVGVPYDSLYSVTSWNFELKS